MKEYVMTSSRSTSKGNAWSNPASIVSVNGLDGVSFTWFIFFSRCYLSDSFRCLAVSSKGEYLRRRCRRDRTKRSGSSATVFSAYTLNLNYISLHLSSAQLYSQPQQHSVHREKKFRHDTVECMSNSGQIGEANSFRLFEKLNW